MSPPPEASSSAVARRRDGRPVIGITGPDRAGLAAWLFGALAVGRAGGRPVRITPSRPWHGALDGLVVGGGADVSPRLYEDEPPEDRVPLAEAGEDLGERAAAVAVGLVRRLLSRKALDARIDEARDTLETGWIVRALADDLPLLGVCRGMQLLNVVCGGNLIQDVRPLYVEHAYVRSVWPRKMVRLAPGSLLERTVCRQTCRVNALHRQAVGRLGEGLVAVAWEPSGIVQAIERPASTFAIGLQWHPELLPQLASQLRLFRSLVRAAARRRTWQDGRGASQRKALAALRS